MNTARMTRIMALPLAAALVALGSGAALAQDEPQAATVAEINAGNVAGTVTLDGAVLAREDDEEYWFSDGTDVIKIDVDTSSADPAIPLLTLINIEGMVASDEIDVTSWAPLDIMTPAVIRTPQEAIEAFWGWIVTQNSQEAIEPAAGE